jgi:hypothetical protein
MGENQNPLQGGEGSKSVMMESEVAHHLEYVIEVTKKKAIQTLRDCPGSTLHGP